MRCRPEFTKPWRGSMFDRCLNTNRTLGHCTVKSDALLSPYVGDLLINVPSRELRWLMKQQITRRHFYGLFKQQLTRSAYTQRQCHDWRSQASCQRSVSDVLFALKSNRFTTSLKAIVCTIIQAWSRQCEIQQENVYAA